MNKSKSLFSLITVCILLLFVACKKGIEPSGEKAAALQPVPLTEEQLNSFEGCLEPGMLSQKSALASLKILAGGSHDKISYYSKFNQSENGKPKGSGEDWYQNDVCVAVKLLSKRNHPEAYDLILQIIDQKTKYPKAIVCAIRAIMIYGKFEDGSWHGDRRSIPVLKKIVNDENPDIRLNASGALLSLGEGDIAMPVIDGLVSAGTEKSIPAIYKMFTPEEKKVEGITRIVRSRTKLFDERGKDLLAKALTNSSDEVQVFAALRLAYLGIEQKRAEETAIEILKQRTVNGKKEYHNMDKRQSDNNTISYAISVLETIASAEGANAIKAFIEGYNDTIFKAKAQTALKNITQ